MAKNFKHRVGVVYSTNPDFQYETDKRQEAETLPPDRQRLKLFFDSKRKGSGMTIVENFIGRDEDAKNLARDLKNLCGSGGSFKDGEILIQGDHREKIQAWLQEKGYQLKRKN